MLDWGMLGGLNVQEWGASVAVPTWPNPASACVTGPHDQSKDRRS